MNYMKKEWQNKKKQSFSHKQKEPSEVEQVYYIYADCNDCDYPNPTEKSGKWLIFIPNKDRI